MFHIYVWISEIEKKRFLGSLIGTYNAELGVPFIFRQMQVYFCLLAVLMKYLMGIGGHGDASWKCRLLHRLF